jgi:hypothetical protein
MTDNETQLLAIGGAIGSYLTLLAWMTADFVSERRADRRRSKQAGRRAAKRTATAEWRDAIPALAGPHPAELLEASVRDFELKLYDVVDRVEDAARRDGLL